MWTAKLICASDHTHAAHMSFAAYSCQSITGERVRRKLKGGGLREHIDYRCANNHPGPEQDQPLELVSTQLPTTKQKQRK